MINPTTHAFAQYVIPSSGNDEAEGITVGPLGNLWFTETAANSIGMINPTTHAFKIYSGVTNDEGLGEITKGPDGNLWFLDNASSEIGTISTSGSVNAHGTDVGDFAVASGIATGADGSLYFGIPDPQNVDGIGKNTPGNNATAIGLPQTVGEPSTSMVSDDGDLWFTQTDGSDDAPYEVGEVDPTTHISTEYPLTSGAYTPKKMAVDTANGTLWVVANDYDGFAGTDPSVIYEIDPTTKTVSQPIIVPGNYTAAYGITYDPGDGDLWFTAPGDNILCTLNPVTDAIAAANVTLPANAGPLNIVVDASDNLWFTDNGIGMVSEYNPTTQVLTNISVGTTGSDPTGIVLGTDKNLWFTQTGSGQIGAINPTTGSLFEQVSVAVDGNLTAGPDNDNAIWFDQGNGLGRISTLTYAITTVTTPDAQPTACATGPDGNVWFTGEGTETGNGGTYPDIIGAVNLSTATIPTQLAVTTEPPASVTAGKGFGLIVSVENASGGVDANFNGTVTIALGANPGGSTLAGTLTATALDGVASFPGLNLNLAGTGYTIVVSSAGLTSATTSAFTVSLAATHLVVTSPPPSSLPANTTFSVTVAAENASGQIDTSYDGTLDVAIGNNPGTGTLSGTTVYGATNGQYTFTGLSLNNPGQDYTLLLTDAANLLQSASTPGFNVTPPPATHLVVTTEPPSSLVAGASFGLVVEAENGLGQVDYAYSGSASLLLVDSNGASIEGTSTLAFANGIATFGGLSIDEAGTGYTIDAISGSLTSAVTTTIGVVSASAAGFTLTPSASTAVPGEQISLTVTAVDSFGNTVANYARTVHFTSSDPHAILPVAYTFNANDQGSHVFTNGVSFATLGGETITATDSTVTPPVSSIVSVQVNTPTATTTSLAVNPTHSIYGQSITLTATVSPNSASGTVTFLDGSTILKTVTLTSTGASLTISTLAAGSHALSVSYGGSTNGTYASSKSATTTFAVASATTALGLTTSGATTSEGHAVTLTATIKVAAPGSGVPTGLVSFYNGTTLIGSAALNASGVATLPFSTRTRGLASITASYAGSANDGTSAASMVQVRVNSTAQADFDGDGKTDIAIFDQATATFAIQLSGGGSKTQQLGNPADVNIPDYGDFDGDGKTDVGLYDQTAATFLVLESGGGSINIPLGNPHDVNVPVTGDFTGSGKSNLAIFDQTTATFYVLELGKVVSQQLGNPGDLNIPDPGDFDGDGKTDFAVFDQTQATFLILDSGGGSRVQQLGVPGNKEVPVAGDFDGDGKTDLAVYDPVASVFLALESGGGTIDRQLGIPGDANVPVLGDFDGDGKTDLAVYDQTVATFLILDSGGGSLIEGYGNPKHKNIPG